MRITAPRPPFSPPTFQPRPQHGWTIAPEAPPLPLVIAQARAGVCVAAVCRGRGRSPGAERVCPDIRHSALSHSVKQGGIQLHGRRRCPRVSQSSFSRSSAGRRRERGLKSPRQATGGQRGERREWVELKKKG